MYVYVSKRLLLRGHTRLKLANHARGLDDDHLVLDGRRLNISARRAYELDAAPPDGVAGGVCAQLDAACRLPASQFLGRADHKGRVAPLGAAHGHFKRQPHAGASRKRRRVLTLHASSIRRQEVDQGMVSCTTPNTEGPGKIRSNDSREDLANRPRATRNITIVR